MARLKFSRGVVVVVAATTSLIAVGIGAAASAPHAGAKVAKTPTVKVTISHGNFTLHGPTSLQAGRVNLAMTVKGKEAEILVVSFAKGYDFDSYTTDFGTYAQGQGDQGESQEGLDALNHLVDNTTFYGGLDAAKGDTSTGSIVLPTAGSYYVFNDTTGTDPNKLKVTGPAVKRATPESSGRITAKSGERFGGDSTVDAKGTLTFSNVSKGDTESPHFLVLQHVKDGTTRKDVEDFFASGNQGNPPFALPGGAQTDVVSPGLSMTLDTDLPKGEYIELCFFPDLMTGVPHAFMGMIGTVTLK
jgi:hypothetical protein